MPRVLETGHIYFFYRPRVQREAAQSLEETQRFYVVLSPLGERVWRLLIVGRKRLPTIRNGGEREWAFVARVRHRPEEIEDELDRWIYGTRTRGERVEPAARPVGEGVYSIVGHDGHTHLAYVLEFPKEAGPVQRDLRIEPAASYVVAVKNPDAPAPPVAGLSPSRKVELPENLRERFDGRRFAELVPDFLDHEGTELIIIAARKQPEEELGIRLDPQDEREAEAAIFRDLKLERDQHPLEPLFKGEWR